MRRQAVSVIALLAAAPLALTAAHGQAVELDEVVLSASHAPTAAGRTGASVAVLDAATLRKAGEARILALLDMVAGVNIRTSGPIGTTAGFSIRGASQNYVRVTLDGIDISDPSGTQVAADLSGLTAGGVERIEVIKGSQSAIHGPNAIGGVIALTSARPTEDGTRQTVRLEGGSHGTASLAWGLTHRSERTEAAVSLSHFRTKGFSAAAAGTEDDGHRATRLNFHVAHELENGVRIGASGYAQRSRTEYDAQFYAPGLPGDVVPVYDFGWGPFVDTVALGDGTSPDEVLNARGAGLRLFAEWQTGSFSHTVALTGTTIRRHNFGTELDLDWGSYVPGAPTGALAWSLTDTTYTGRRLGLDYRATGEISHNLRASFGAELARESYRQTGTWGLGSGSVRTAGAFGELQWAASDRLDISAALRYDRHSDFGGAISGRLAAAWRLADDLVLRAQAGTGYRAPSSYERFAPGFGNAALQPERSRSFDLGIEKRFGERGYLRATAFVLSVDDLIDFAGAGYNQVPGTSRRQGIEIEGQVALNQRITLSGSWTHIASPTSAAAGWAVAPPKNAVTLGLGAQLGERLSGAVTLRHAAGLSGGLANYTVVNAGLEFDFGQQTSAWLRVDNLFDRQYQTVPGYGTSGRAVYVGLRKAF